MTREESEITYLDGRIATEGIYRSVMGDRILKRDHEKSEARQLAWQEVREAIISGSCEQWAKSIEENQRVNAS